MNNIIPTSVYRKTVYVTVYCKTCRNTYQTLTGLIPSSEFTYFGVS